MEHGDITSPEGRPMPGRPRGLWASAPQADVAAQAGISLVQLSTGFVLARPEVASALVGPRTLQQLDELLQWDVPELDADVLAAIDAVVEPGLNVNPKDAG